MKNHRSEWLTDCFGDALTDGKTAIVYINDDRDLEAILAADNTINNIINGYTGELIYTRR